MSALSLLKNRNILVTEGDGYIASHTSRQLINAGCNVVVVDNFYSGHRGAVPKKAIRLLSSRVLNASKNYLHGGLYCRTVI